MHSRTDCDPAQNPWPTYFAISATVPKRVFDRWRIKTGRTFPQSISSIGNSTSWNLGFRTVSAASARAVCQQWKRNGAKRVVVCSQSLQEVSLRAAVAHLANRDSADRAGVATAIAQAVNRYLRKECPPIAQACARLALRELSRAGSLLPEGKRVAINPDHYPMEWELGRPMRLQAALIRSAKTRLPEIEATLRRINGHWTGEDGFYRFYHQSMKVYWLQNSTTEAVTLLRDIGKGAGIDSLNGWFEKIVADGTNKHFAVSHNAKWLEETRPILEAFFHAREMLAFLGRYAKRLKTAISSLPSGWAAVLYLYGIR